MPILALLFLLFWSGPTLAASPQRLPLADGTRFEFDLPAGWIFSRSPPAFLVREAVADLSRELAARDKKVPAGRIEEVARQRLGANDGFVYRPATRALLLIDFSALGPDEAAPDSRTLERSARYAADSLRQESGGTKVGVNIRPATLAWLPGAWRLEARYLEDGGENHFVGFIGYFAPYWVYLYYTGRGRDSVDIESLKMLLESAHILPPSEHGN